MGGSVFTKGAHPLFTPRMPRQVYTHVRDNMCLAPLRELFAVVASPLEGPGKTDYGDIDVAVTWPKEGAADAGDAGAAEAERKKRDIEKGKGQGSKDWLGLAAAAIGGVKVQRINGSDSQIHVAVPWPRKYGHLQPQESSASTVQTTTTSISTTTDDLRNTPFSSSASTAFIQVDIHIFPTLQELQWSLFKHAHGDLWGILGSVIRPYGLTADEVGLYLRIPEIERHDHKRAKVWLTSEPEVVLAFLGMEGGSSDVWARPFDDKEGFFEYAASTRLFRGRRRTAAATEEGGEGCTDVPHVADRKDVSDSTASYSGEHSTPVSSGQAPYPASADANGIHTASEVNASELVEESTKYLRSGERRRMKYRPLFAEFMHKYFPEHHHNQQGLSSLLYDDVRGPTSPSAAAGQADGATTTNSESASQSTALITTESPKGKNSQEYASPQEQVVDSEAQPEAQELQYQQSCYTRESIREEAFTRFGPTVRLEYNKRLQEWTVEKQRIRIKKELIKGIVPPASTPRTRPGLEKPPLLGAAVERNSAAKVDNAVLSDEKHKVRHERQEQQAEESFTPSFRGQVTSALSKIVLDADFSLGIIPLKPLVDPKTGLYREDEIETFVTEKWRDVARILAGEGAIAWEQKQKRAPV